MYFVRMYVHADDEFMQTYRGKQRENKIKYLNSTTTILSFN